jgi:hypothetical protein
VAERSLFEALGARRLVFAQKTFIIKLQLAKRTAVNRKRSLADSAATPYLGRIPRKLE